MPIDSTLTDTEALTLTLVADFPVDAARVWALWADPRQLERWWGPPTWPARFHRLDLRPGGTAAYVMTGPDGSAAGGMWEFAAVEEPRGLTFDDRFADEEGNPTPDMPVTHTTVVITEATDAEPRTRMTLVTRFDSAEQLEQLMQMGMVEGLTEAVSQIDGILAEQP
jgi:uncharacterized protein YndB with AHSA1/START domain